MTREGSATGPSNGSDATSSGSDAASTTPPALAVVRVTGPSDAGKTTLVERLIAELDRELTVATVKSIHHEIEPDTPGTDTHRHRTAGAASVVGITPTLSFEVSPIGADAEGGGGEPGDPGGSDATTESDAAKRSALYETLRRFADRGYDLVLLEGFSGTPFPTIRFGEPPDRDPEGDVIATGDEEFSRILAAVRGVEATTLDDA